MTDVDISRERLERLLSMKCADYIHMALRDQLDKFEVERDEWRNAVGQILGSLPLKDIISAGVSVKKMIEVLNARLNEAETIERLTIERNVLRAHISRLTAAGDNLSGWVANGNAKCVKKWNATRDKAFSDFRDFAAVKVTDDLPESIWAGKFRTTWWQARPHHQMTEYTRTDTIPALEAAAHARGKAEGIREALNNPPTTYGIYGADRTDRYAQGYCGGVEAFRKSILALLPPDESDPAPTPKKAREQIAWEAALHAALNHVPDHWTSGHEIRTKLFRLIKHQHWSE